MTAAGEMGNDTNIGTACGWVILLSAALKSSPSSVLFTRKQMMK